MNEQSIIDIEYEKMVTETEGTWLLVIEGDEEWFPKSQCEVDKDMYLISVPVWLAFKKGLM